MSGRAEIRYHPGVAQRDLPRIARQLGTDFRLQEFLEQMNSAIGEILGDRGIPSSQLRPPLSGWYRKKFHSRSLPPLAMSADARIIYRRASDGSVLYIMAVGLRLPGSPDDIYALAGARPVHEE